MAQTLSLENPVFKDFAFFATILAAKCMVMGFLTSRKRIGAQVFTTPEDYASFGKPDKPNKQAEDEVERIRNAHRNDMENIYPFFTLGFLYCLCDPNAVIALWLFRVFTVARICHTIVYLNSVRQPFRAICYFIGQAVNFTLCGLIVKQILEF